MTEGMLLAVPGAELSLDARIGMIAHLAFRSGDRRIAPLHAAPWRNDPEVQADGGIAPVERRLAGDFFCAPFGRDDSGGDGPIHGYSANSPWDAEEIVQGRDGARARLRLMRPVMGARIEKELRLAPDVPALSQVHRIEGGAGGLTVAHHPMLRLAAGGWLSVSPKRRVIGPAAPIEAGRNRLAAPGEAAAFGAFPAAAGGTEDLSRLPPPREGAEGHEDFVTLVEAAPSGLGWSVAIREAEDDLVFFLKDAAVLPVTMLWFSNGGRDGSPWSGRHTGVVGIEDGCTAGAAGLAAARGDNPVRATGVATCLPLGAGRKHVIRHTMGAVPRPAGWERVASVEIAPARDGLRFTEARGETLDIPMPDSFLPV